MFLDGSLHLGLGFGDLVSHPLNVTLHLLQFAFCLAKFILQVSHSLLELANFVLKTKLDLLFSLDCLFVSFFNLLNCISMILLFLSKLSIEITIELCYEFFMIHLQLPDLFGMLGFELFDLLT